MPDETSPLLANVEGDTYAGAADLRHDIASSDSVNETIRDGPPKDKRTIAMASVVGTWLHDPCFRRFIGLLGLPDDHRSLSCGYGLDNCRFV